MKTSALFIIMGLYHSKERLIELTNGEISVENLEIIHEHLLDPELCGCIDGFVQQNGILFFRMENGEMISIEPKRKQNPIWNKRNYLN